MKTAITVFVIFSISVGSKLLFAQNIWNVYTKSNSGICSDTITSIYENSGIFWFGTVSGVSKYDGSNWTNFTYGNSPFTEYNNVTAIISFKGAMYFGTLSGLLKYDGSWSSAPDFPNTMIMSMDTDASGNLWVGTHNGVYKYDGFNTINYNPGNSLLPSYWVSGVKKDNTGNVWIAMMNDHFPSSNYNAGIAKFNGSSWQFYNTQNSKLTNENIHSITKDNEGNMWFGADSLLLFKFDGVNWNRYDLSSQITSNWFSSLAADADLDVQKKRRAFQHDAIFLTFST